MQRRTFRLHLRQKAKLTGTINLVLGLFLFLFHTTIGFTQLPGGGGEANPLTNNKFIG